MRYFRIRERSRRFLFVCAAATVVVLGGTAAIAYASYPTSGVQVYTGCLTPQGNLNNVAANASAPLHACGSGQKLVHLSGGTITAVSAGTGLSGGGNDGSVGLSLASGYKLPQGCTSGQVAKSSGSNTWACANDANTTYSGADFATSGQDCPAHQFATGIDGNGDLKCAPPTVDDLQGSACTVDGNSATLTVTTDATTGAVSMTCNQTFTVGLLVSGTLEHVTITEGVLPTIVGINVSGPFMSPLVPAGVAVTITMFNHTPFAYNCDASRGGGDPAPQFNGGYQASCSVSSLSEDFIAGVFIGG